MISACAPGKIILFGEHAVVYNRPALAVPVNGLKACVHIEPSPGDLDGTIWINAPALGLRKSINAMAVDNPLAQSCRLTLELLQKRTFPSFEITIKSSIPTASGMGSGAAVTIAIIRAVARYFDSMIADKDVNNIAFEVEKIYHGTPSGIDNTVITYNRPVFFIRDITMEPFSIKQPFNLLIADTGVHSPTAEAVTRVRESWEQDRDKFEKLFDCIGDITTSARAALANGNMDELGLLMEKNQKLLEALGVSAPENNRLIKTALDAGALGAKISGAGLGGNVIVLTQKPHNPQLKIALMEAGAAACYLTEVSP